MKMTVKLPEGRENFLAISAWRNGLKLLRHARVMIIFIIVIIITTIILDKNIRE